MTSWDNSWQLLVLQKLFHKTPHI